MDTDNSLQTTVSVKSSLLIEGAVYNGDIWKKIDLIKYIDQALKYLDEEKEYEKKSTARRNRMSAIYPQMKRRTLSMPVVTEPKGLARLSPSKRRNYAQWLANAPAREKRQAEFDQAEDIRINALQGQIEQIKLEGERERAEFAKIAYAFRDHMLMHILPPDYRLEEVMRKMLSYLMNGRANTLQEAMNLYHQEMHWLGLENIAKAQKEEIRKAQLRQEELIREQMEMQRELAEEQNELLRDTAEAARATQRASEETNLWLMLDYFSDKNS